MHSESQTTVTTTATEAAALESAIAQALLVHQQEQEEQAATAQAERQAAEQKAIARFQLPFDEATLNALPTGFAVGPNAAVGEKSSKIGAAVRGKTMKLGALKAKTYSVWLVDYLSEDLDRPIYSASTHPEFKSVIRNGFGDLRRRSTWEAAFVSLTAQHMRDYNSHSQYLVERSFIDSPEKEGYAEYVPQILEQFLKTEGGMDCIATGLQYALKNGLAVTTKPAVLNFLQLGYQVAKRLQLEHAFTSAMAESVPLLATSAA